MIIKKMLLSKLQNIKSCELFFVFEFSSLKYRLKKQGSQ